MVFGQLVIGSPGSGKTTYCDGLHQFLTALGRPISIVNLDPANGRSLPYPCAVNIADLITVKDVMAEVGLGPNGAMLYCIEYLEENFEWLEERLNQLGDDAYIAFDLPGQVELSTNHGSLRRILDRLQKKDFRLVAVHLLDASHIADASRYVSLLLLSLRAMLTLELPHVNVLSKVDLLGEAASARRRGSLSTDESAEDGRMERDDDERADTDESMSNGSSPRGGLAFNLSYYTEVQDLSYLVEHLNESLGPRRAKRFGQLNEKICEIIEEFGLVQFETLAVEDKRSMMRLQRILDKATGYVYVEQESKTSTQKGQDNAAKMTRADPSSLRDIPLPAPNSTDAAGYEMKRSIDEQEGSRRGTAASASALFSVADHGAPMGWGSAADVQERWVDHREAWAPFEAKERKELEQRWREREEREKKEEDAMRREQERMKPVRERK